MLLTHNFHALPLIFSSFATSTYARRAEKSENKKKNGKEKLAHPAPVRTIYNTTRSESVGESRRARDYFLSLRGIFNK